jgi:hypothetical protein
MRQSTGLSETVKMAENDRETVEALINELISTLKQGQMWTERRDVADCLANTCKHIVAALEDVIKSEKDVDVRVACEQALNAVREHLQLIPVQVEAPAPAPTPEPAPTQVTPTAAEQPVSLGEIVRSDIEGAGVTVTETEDGYEIVTRLESGRFQKVFLVQSRDETKGLELIHIFTVCGPANSRVFKWALEANSKLMHGALAIRTLGGKEMLVITDTYQAATVRREQVRDAVFAIAETGDVVEKGMTRVDTL